MADALFVIDATGCMRVTNHTVRELLGYPDSDLLGRSTGQVLVLLDQRKMVIIDTVGQRLNVPELRVNWIVTAVRKMMNVEGYALVSLDDGAKTVTLNYDLLRAQFDLEE